MRRLPTLSALLRPAFGDPTGGQPATPGRLLVVAAVALTAIGTTVSVVVPAGRAVRNAACGSGPDGCDPFIPPAADLGRCTVISHSDPVADDTVLFSDRIGPAGGVVLSRAIDTNAVVTWHVDEPGTSPGRATIRSFADEDTARNYVTEVLREPLRQRLAAADGSGVTAWLGVAIDGHRIDPPTPREQIALLGGAVDTVAEAKDGAAATQPTTPAALVQISDHLSPAGEPVRTLVRELDWRAAVAMGLGSEKAAGRVLMSTTHTAAGIPLRETVEITGLLAAGLDPTGAAAGPAPLAALLPRPEPLALFPAKMIIDLDLATDGTADLRAALERLAGLPHPASWTSLVSLEERSGARPAAIARAVRAQSSLRPRSGLYRALDQTPRGTTVTISTFRRTSSVNRPTTELGLRGHLNIAGGLPAGDYYLARGTGFVKWQECGDTT